MNKNSDGNPSYCPECKKTFSRVTHLRRHAKKFHPDKLNVIAPKLPGNFECRICDKKFSNKQYFNRHKRYHVGPRIVNRKKLSCPMCTYFSPEPQQLMEHFVTIHDIKFLISTNEFSSFSDFQAWKKIIEHDRKELYVKKKSDITTNKDKIIKKYYCHRSGNYVSKSKGLRQLKQQGSNKIDAFCPASMKVVTSNGKCKVVFIETHVGHGKELTHLFLTPEDRESIAAKISMNLPSVEILNGVRESVNESELKRVHLLNKKDLYNIKQCFNLKLTRPKNDRGSVVGQDTKILPTGQEIDTKSDTVNVEGQNIGKEIETNQVNFLIYETELERVNLLNKNNLFNIDHCFNLKLIRDKKEPSSIAGQDIKVLSIREEIELLRDRFNGYLSNITTLDEIQALKKLMASMEPTLAALKT